MPLLVRLGVRHNGVVGLVCQCFVVFKFRFRVLGLPLLLFSGLSLRSCSAFLVVVFMAGVAKL